MEQTVDNNVGGRPCVVVAEDDPEMRRLMAAALRHDGNEVVEVGSGLALHDEVRRARADGALPALIVSDIRMPGMSGLAVLETLRSWGCQMPIILITAFGSEETLDHASRAGATAVFDKPFDLDDLRTAVRCFLPSAPRPRA